ncbi:MAG TPA: outer membrane beta-barrel protein [Xanthobacteraceae bacterium]|jgi:opacity protein-like surface antigen
MSNSKYLALAAVVASALTLQPARAADMPMPYIPAPVVEEYGGWYLRGYIGMSNQQFRGLDHVLFATAPGFTWIDTGGFSSAPFFGGAVGYQYNSWLRFDFSAEYRGGANFKALDSFLAPGPVVNTNDYTAIKKEWLFLFNAFADLGTWRSITPYVGAGLGFANVTISNFRDTNVIAGGGAYADTGSQWNFAWALYAGLAYKVTPTFSVDLGYRFVSLGDGKTGILTNLDGTCTACQPMYFRGIYSHDVMLGMRWMLDDGGYAPPIMRKG